MSKVSGLHRKEQRRLFCQGHAAKARLYKKVLDKWVEQGDGSVVVSVKEGYSFDAKYDVKGKVYPNVEAAQKFMRETNKGNFIPLRPTNISHPPTGVDIQKKSLL